MGVGVEGVNKPVSGKVETVEKIHTFLAGIERRNGWLRMNFGYKLQSQTWIRVGHMLGYVSLSRAMGWKSPSAWAVKEGREEGVVVVQGRRLLPPSQPGRVKTIRLIRGTLWCMATDKPKITPEGGAGAWEGDRDSERERETSVRRKEGLGHIREQMAEMRGRGHRGIVLNVNPPELWHLDP